MMSEYIMDHHQTEELYRSVSMECGGLFVAEELGMEPQKYCVPNLDIREGVSDVLAVHKH